MSANFTLVLFGANSDLAARKLFPSIFQLSRWGQMPEKYRIIGLGRPQKAHDEFRKEVRRKIMAHAPDTVKDEAELEAFSSNLFYVRHDLAAGEGLEDLRREVMRGEGQAETCQNILFYLSTPPSLAPRIIGSIDAAGLGGRGASECGGWRKIILEKPFGHDLQSARELNRAVRKVFHEEQIYRIDHYLGKEPVQNIIVFRFSNGMFEPIWNRHYIDNVRITIAEDFGIRDRGAYYEESGLLRDIIQNHGLQLLASVAMEPPVDLSPDAVRDEKGKVFRSVRLFTPESASRDVILGQYEGYHEEDHVAPDSRVETFASVKFFVDNWRWMGVPFHIKAGKNLAETVTEIVITFKCPPQNFFGPPGSCSYTANQVVIRIQPEETIAIRFGTKRPGESMVTDPVYMKFDYKASFSNAGLTPYHRLLLDAMSGDQMHFIRDDAVESSWAVIDSIKSSLPDMEPYPYAVHSWGPESVIQVRS